MKWEYCQIIKRNTHEDVPKYIVTMNDKTRDVPQWEGLHEIRVLDVFGDEGWELVQVIRVSADWTQFYLKRPIGGS